MCEYVCACVCMCVHVFVCGRLHSDAIMHVSSSSYDMCSFVCLRLHSDAIIASLTGGTSPAGPAQVEVHDLIRGVVRFPADKIDDAVLLKVVVCERVCACACACVCVCVCV